MKDLSTVRDSLTGEYCQGCEYLMYDMDHDMRCSKATGMVFISRQMDSGIETCTSKVLDERARIERKGW